MGRTGAQSDGTRRQLGDTLNLPWAMTEEGLDETTTTAEEWNAIHALPYSLVDEDEAKDLWWTRWSLLAPYWQGYKRSLLQGSFNSSSSHRTLK